MTWSITISELARQMLADIADRRVREVISRRIDKLAEDPDKQGKPLGGDLAGCRSVRAAGQRYRILYRLREAEVEVLVVALGRRRQGDKRDVYEAAKRLFAVGRLGEPEG